MKKNAVKLITYTKNKKTAILKPQDLRISPLDHAVFVHGRHGKRGKFVGIVALTDSISSEFAFCLAGFSDCLVF